MSFGERIKKLRLKRNLTQEELSKKANISRVAIGNYERNDRIPNIAILQRIANALDVDVNDLIPTQQDAIDLFYEPTTIPIVFEVPNQENIKDSNGIVHTKVISREEILRRFFDVGYIMRNKDNEAYYNGHLLSDEERRRALDMLKLLFPEYQDDEE